MSNSKQLSVPGEPWGSIGFISYIMSQVSLPYRAQKSKEIVRRHGSLVVMYVATGNALPYGKYPRLMEMYACTMIKRGDPSFHPDTGTLDLGSSFRDFLRLLSINVGGRQLKVIKPQLENYFATAITITNNTSTTSNGMAFVVANRWNIDWLNDKSPVERGTAHNWVRFSQEYIDYLRDKPVPVDLPTVAKISSPMALDIYWWLTKRYYNMHDRVDVTWRQLYDQFGSNSKDMWKFRQTFKKAVASVLEVYPQARITCGRDYVTLWPSETSVPTVSQRRVVERRQERSSRDGGGSWRDIKGWGQVYSTKALFQVDQARNHLDGVIATEECPYCKYDERNLQFHGIRASIPKE